jgi:hypothetical protein
MVTGVHCTFVEAESQAAQTDPFGGTSTRLESWGLASRAAETHRAAVVLGKSATDEWVRRHRVGEPTRSVGRAQSGSSDFFLIPNEPRIGTPCPSLVTIRLPSLLTLPSLTFPQPP